MPKHMQDLKVAAVEIHKNYTTNRTLFKTPVKNQLLAGGQLAGLFLSLVVSLTNTSFAEVPSQKQTVKSKLNTQIYTKEDESESFTDEVTLVREIAGEFQVKFKTKPGIYRIPEGSESLQNRLVKAQKNQLRVTVKADKESRQIQEVMLEGM
jgi:hypothetical protein